MSKRNTKTSLKATTPQADPLTTPPSYKHSAFDPRSPTADRTPLVAPKEMDPRSPTVARTPIYQAKEAPAAFDPRSPLPEEIGARTPLAARTVNTRGSPMSPSKMSTKPAPRAGGLKKRPAQ